MKLAFAVEPWEQFYEDAKQIFPAHYEELALHQDRIALDIDEEKYRDAQAKGNLHIITVRVDGELVGYYVAAITNHLHYKSAGSMAYTDLYFLKPEWRRGGLGAKMLMYLEHSLKGKVVEIYASTKIHQNHAGLFEALGYKPSDIILRKSI